VCVSLHDVAPATWPACQQLLRAVEAVAPIPLTLLVVPNYRRRGDGDASFRRALSRRLDRGDELALHGYVHRDEGPPPRGPGDWLRRRWYTAGEGEFAALDRASTHERLEAGRRWFAQNDWPLAGFVAPGWLMNEPTWAWLRASGLRYATTLRALHRLDELRCLPAQSLVYSVRGAWRRGLSRAWNAHLDRHLRAEPLLRLSLHPADAAFPRVVAHWQGLIARALHDREPLTKAGFCVRWSGE